MQDKIQKQERISIMTKEEITEVIKDYRNIITNPNLYGELMLDRETGKIYTTEYANSSSYKINMDAACVCIYTDLLYNNIDLLYMPITDKMINDIEQIIDNICYNYDTSKQTLFTEKSEDLFRLVNNTELEKLKDSGLPFEKKSLCGGNNLIKYATADEDKIVTVIAGKNVKL